jgi:hypothetical protein
MSRSSIFTQKRSPQYVQVSGTLSVQIKRVSMSKEKVPVDPELTQDQLEFVQNLTKEQIEEIDQALLHNISGDFRKVGRLVGGAMNSQVTRIKGVPDIFYAQRVYHLVECDVLMSQGHFKNMGYCEVKLNENT